MTKPELRPVCFYYTTALTQGNTIIQQYISPALGNPITGTALQTLPYNTPVNNFARLHTFTLTGNVQYSTLTQTVAPVNFRIVILQLKASRSEGITADDVFQSQPSTTNNTSIFVKVQI